MALHLARNGAGRFVLIDTDCMEIHNDCRHQCSLPDVGRYKVDAVAERILQINPDAQIRKFCRRIQDVPRDLYADWIDPKKALFIGACDNRVGNAYACDAAYSFGAPFLALGFMPRAWGAELFMALPDRGDICYRCAFRTQIRESVAEERRNHVYMDLEDAAEVHFEPGLDTDISYGVAIACKVALDLLNRCIPEYHFKLAHRLTQLTYFSGTDDRTGADPFWTQALPRPLDYKCFDIDENCRRDDCEYCGRQSPQTVRG